MIDINIEYIDEGYYLTIVPDNEYDTCCTDEEVSDFLDIPENYLTDILLYRFKGHMTEYGVFFNDFQKVKNAKIWLENNLETFLIAKKIIGK